MGDEEAKTVDARAEKLAKAIAILENSERQAREDAEDRIILAAELIAKYTSEIGKRGLDFDVLDCGAHGVVAYKRVDAITMSKWDETADSYTKKSAVIPTVAWVNFTAPAILYPETRVYREMCLDSPARPGASSLPIMLGGAIKILHGAYAREVSSK